MYIIHVAPHMQHKEVITKINLPTMKDHLDNLNSNFFRKIKVKDVHYLLPKPHPAKRTGS